jgi:methionine-rich copper-binding protein CopC
LAVRRILIAAICGVALAPIAAHAHAILMSSTPAAGTSVPAGKVDMSFRYNSRIDRARSRLTLIRPDRSEAVLKIIPAGSPDLLETSTELSAPGAYVVRWQVLAIDGHITRGDVPFTVTGH